MEQVAYHRAQSDPGLVLSTGCYSSYTFKPHYHLDYHLGMIVDGVQRQKINGETALFGPGCISVVPPDQVHDGSTYSGDSYTLRTFRVAPALIEGALAEMFELASGTEFRGALLQKPAIAKGLIALHDSLAHGQSLSSMGCEQQWISLLQPLFAELGQLRPIVVSGGLGMQHWRQVRDYCHANLANKIVLDELAQLCRMSRFQFLRRFEATTGLTPRAWLIRLRLESACELLSSGKHSILDVATAVGFYDQSHFNRAFRQAFGVAPSAY
ncbi:MAG: AraC family ligand binding domain-containing protein [Pseudomonadales bacterium]